MVWIFAARYIQVGGELETCGSLEAVRDHPGLDVMAFPENVFACILEALPPEQLLNVSRVCSSHTPLRCRVLWMQVELKSRMQELLPPASPG